ncbi:hypothetical protein ACHQM5_006915 [Ranunculus cassubicifolius]
MTEEDSEQRFHSIMDKLFNTPNTKSISRKESTRGKKRGNSVLSDSGLNIVPVSGLNRSLVPAGSMSSSPPICRPWNRGDLMRRLATFKSMTWFGKPKVVSAVNCARRGWINIEMDILSCEACGARLLFSNPSSWTQQQIEKAAAVFSLKLDNGHKLLCPWIDNACDESLAQFPPTPDPSLIDSYKKRFSSLLQLSALPVISSSALDYMRCPQLECFLERSALDFDIESTDTARIQYLDHELAASANLYYQAQKIISLCGWEPRSLPYAVDCKESSTPRSDNNHSERISSPSVYTRSPGVVMYTRSGVDDVMDADESPSLDALQSDPASVVLDCKFCGATAGLWAFSTVERPLEWFRVIESLEVAGQNDSSNNEDTLGPCTPIQKRNLSLNLSIAGGPPPEKQSYRATVSLPIISRHLRAAISSKSDARNQLISSSDHETFSQSEETLVESSQTMAPNSDRNEELTTENGSQINECNAVVPVANGRVKDQTLNAKDPKGVEMDQSLEFDPIKQHRHFCPWIVSEGRSGPGWRTTLKALDREKVLSRPSLPDSSPSAPTFDVDDPITSVRNLFQSPSAKRIKTSHNPR